jgi:hypothetical protein
MLISTFVQGLVSFLLIAWLLELVFQEGVSLENPGGLELYKLLPFATHVFVMLMMAVSTRGW